MKSRWRPLWTIETLRRKVLCPMECGLRAVSSRVLSTSRVDSIECSTGRARTAEFETVVWIMHCEIFILPPEDADPVDVAGLLVPEDQILACLLPANGAILSGMLNMTTAETERWFEQVDARMQVHADAQRKAQAKSGLYRQMVLAMAAKKAAREK